MCASTPYDSHVTHPTRTLTRAGQVVILAHVPVDSTPFGEPVRAHVRYLLRDAIERSGYVCVEAEITARDDVENAVGAHDAPLVFNLCYGLRREAQPDAGQPELADWFEAAGGFLVGSGGDAQRRCQDKLEAGVLSEKLGVAAPRVFTFDEALGYTGPLIVKPRAGAAHRGVRIIKTPSQLAEAPPTPADMVQEYLDGPEYTIGVLGNRVSGVHTLPLVRIRYRRDGTDPAIYEWSNTSMAPDSPNRFGIAEAALALFNALGLEDYARFDFRAVRGRGPVLMDANALPNLAPRQLLATSARWDGLAFPDLIAALLSSATARQEARVNG